MDPHAGTLVLVVGVSGSGKGALLKEARLAFPDAVYPVSCTTRAIRPKEREGETYHFISDTEFDARIAADDFLEWASYGGYRYGTLKNEILPALQAGKMVVREVDVQGVQAIRAALPTARIVTIFVHAGSWETLEQRIMSRAPMTVEELEKRRARFTDEMQFAEEADVVIDNCDGAFEQARDQFLTELGKLVTLST